MVPAFKKPEWLARFHRHLKDPALNRRLDKDPTLRALHDRISGLELKTIRSRPVRDTRFVSIDTETTGFGVYSGDAIVAIAMLELQGFEYTGRHYYSLVNPAREIPDETTRIHGIRTEDVRDAPSIEELIPAIVAFIDDAVIVGHHTNFDLRFLNKTLHKLTGCRLRNPSLDTMLMYLEHSGRMGHYSLEDVAAYCRVDITNRHTAEGDARTAADIFLALAPRLADPADSVGRLIGSQHTNELV